MRKARAKISNKARLIKKKDIPERIEPEQILDAAEMKVDEKIATENSERVEKPEKPETIDEWIENQRLQPKDPRKAFAALFVRPQTQYE